MKKGLIVVVIVLVVAVGGFVGYKAMHKNKATPAPVVSAPATDAANTSNTQSSASSTPSSSEAPMSVTITYDGNSFSPSSVTVKAGGTVTIKNTSSKMVQFDSDPHPVHTDDTELNEGEIAPGKSATITVNNKGTHGYHNHLDPSQTGTIVVQ